METKKILSPRKEEKNEAEERKMYVIIKM